MKINLNTRTAGFAFVDVIVLVVVLMTLAFAAVLVFPKWKTSKILCQNTLHGNGIAFFEFAADHGGRFPSAVPSQDGGSLEYSSVGESAYIHYRALSRYLPTTMSLICPQDNRRAVGSWESLRNQNISYFFGICGTSGPSRVFLAGDRNLSTNDHSIFKIEPGVLVKWHHEVGLHGEEGHILFGDGHVSKLTSSELENKADGLTNVLAIP
jgi:prepilin-type processing-associated H-X9-DG protein